MAFVLDDRLETERLVLRPFNRGDVDAVHGYRSREDVARFLFDGPLTREECAEIVQQRIGNVRWAMEGDRIILAIERRAGGPVIGEISLIWRSAEARQGELGYILDPEQQGRGYATEAAGRMLSLGFDRLGLHRITARCDVRNASSWRLMERLGMRREAHFHDHALFKGAWEEEYVYALVEDEWRSRERHIA